MKKNISINSNLAKISINSASQVKATNNPQTVKQVASSVPLNLCNDIVDALLEQRSVLPLLVQIKYLLQMNIPLSGRPMILQELNKILGALFYQFSHDNSLFRQAHEVMTLMNKQIDKHPQKNEHLAEKEWEELQKTVYLLTDWEDMLSDRSMRLR